MIVGRYADAADTLARTHSSRGVSQRLILSQNPGIVNSWTAEHIFSASVGSASVDGSWLRSCFAGKALTCSPQSNSAVETVRAVVAVPVPMRELAVERLAVVAVGWLALCVVGAVLYEGLKGRLERKSPEIQESNSGGIDENALSAPALLENQLTMCRLNPYFIVCEAADVCNCPMAIMLTRSAVTLVPAEQAPNE